MSDNLNAETPQIPCGERAVNQHRTRSPHCRTRKQLSSASLIQLGHRLTFHGRVVCPGIPDQICEFALKSRSGHGPAIRFRRCGLIRT